MELLVDFFINRFAWITNIEIVARQALAGLAMAMLLFLISSGMTLIVGVTRVLNFAHGALYMLGAYLALTVVRSITESYIQFMFAIFLAPIGVALLGAIFEVLILRHVYRSEHSFQLLVTFALVLILGEFVKIPWGDQNYSVEVPNFLNGIIYIGDIIFPVYRIFIIFFGFSVGFSLWMFLYRTRWGMAIRAIASDREMVDAIGVNVKGLYTAMFALGSGLAGLAGALSAPIVAVGPSLHTNALIDAFIVVVIGGLGSVGGALIGALILCEINAFSLLAFPAATLVINFAIMAVILILRPWGIFGKPE
jgi:branched-chain amino acid transport system permease protein